MILELVERWATERPRAFALRDETGRWTYEELSQTLGRMAGELRRVGVRPGDTVAYLGPRNAGAIQTLLAVLQCDAIFAPLGSWSTSTRVLRQLDANDTRWVIGPRRSVDQLQTGRRSTIAVERLLELDPAGSPPWHPDPTHPLAPAFLISTSGSTGTPKPVVVTRGGLAHLATTLSEVLPLQLGDRVAQFATLTFDASIWEILIALRIGGELVCVPRNERTPDQIAEYMTQTGIQVATLPPAFLASLDPSKASTLRVVISAGDVCPSSVVRTWAPSRSFVNAYGPTEATICATLGLCDASEDPPAIGRTLPGVTASVLDGLGKPVEPGENGELYIGGPGVATGYRGQPRDTASSFVPDPNGAPGARRYRTGDLVRQNPDGSLQFIGRRDNQISLRGYRIEAEEVERALYGLPGVGDAAVGLTHNERGDPVLTAFVVLEDDRLGTRPDRGTTADSLRAALASMLPDYMIPTRILFRTTLPRSPTGKLERSTLNPSVAPDPPAAPETPTERAIGEIWARHLGLSSVGRSDHFLEIGGHSLVAAQVITEIRDRFSPDIPIRLLFSRPVLRDFAAAIDDL